MSEVYLPVSGESVVEAAEAKWARWQTEKRLRRAEERDAAEHVPLGLQAVLDKLGWSVEYAGHFVQPYCTCGVVSDGWDYCQHAYDEMEW